MTVALSASVVVLGIIVFLTLGSQIELYRTVEQLREYSGLIDRTVPLSLAQVGARPSSAGLPPALDSALWSVVLLLSDKCATCRSIAASLNGAVPPDLFVVVEPDAGERADLTMTYDLNAARTIVDPKRRISAKLGIKVTPAAVIVEHGRLVRATTVPSSRQLQALLEPPRVFDSMDSPSLEGEKREPWERSEL
jgi:hypothetical protein